MDYFYNEEQERRFHCYPDRKQEIIMNYAKKHDAVIGFKSDWCWRIDYLYHYHYESDWRYGKEGLNLLETVFLLPDNSVTNGLCVIHPGRQSEAKHIDMIPQNHKEWEICTTQYPSKSGLLVRLVRDYGSYKLVSDFMHSKYAPFSLIKYEDKNGITKYIYHLGSKQYSIRNEISEETYNYIKQRAKEIEAEDRKKKS